MLSHALGSNLLKLADTVTVRVEHLPLQVNFLPFGHDVIYVQPLFVWLEQVDLEWSSVNFWAFFALFFDLTKYVGRLRDHSDAYHAVLNKFLDLISLQFWHFRLGCAIFFSLSYLLEALVAARHQR